ncbi:MAG: BREX-1 system phosphatase PglZ type B, partial [Deltaproteobacteria bacterium]|nr:BREX-1 system phosphatase PglZ type B [Deltaproteobacteria bacterium]
METVIQRIVKSIRSSAKYNADAYVGPACILWPDKDRQWSPVIPSIRIALPELLTLGDYDPETLTGPGIWIRCAIAGSIEGIRPPEGTVPVVYMPGVSRQELRAVEECEESIKPLVELQYRGSFWSGPESRDWTVPAFFSSSEKGGLGLDLDKKDAAKSALREALPILLGMDISELEGIRLDKAYFVQVKLPDPEVSVLRWLDGGEEYRKATVAGTWPTLVKYCEDKLNLNPELEDVGSAARRFADREGKWSNVWNRYREAPRRYPGIRRRLLDIHPGHEAEVFWVDPSPGVYDGWPQWNDYQENKLLAELAKLADEDALEPEAARKRILVMEENHAGRRGTVWAELGYAPLA